MGRAKDDVNKLGEFLKDRRHGAKHVLDPLVRRDQAECQGDRSSFDTELLLAKVGGDERSIGNAMGDQIDLRFGNAVNLDEELAGMLGHDHDTRGELDKLHENPPLMDVRVFEHGVKGGDNRHSQVADQAQDVAAGHSAIDPIFVLQTDEIRVGEVKKIGRAEIAGQVLLVDFKAYFRRIVVTIVPVVDGDHRIFRVRKTLGDRGIHVMRERGNTALAGQIITHECNFVDFGVAHFSSCLLLSVGHIRVGRHWRLSRPCHGSWEGSHVRDCHSSLG